MITSGKDTFSGGADITMLQKMLAAFAAEKGKDAEKATKALFDNAGYMTGLFRKLETSGKPGCRRSTAPAWAARSSFRSPATAVSRPIRDKVKMALPEVKIGIFPGAGGTQRVPRLTDQQQALQMLTSGQTLSPQKAKAMGLIHEIAEPGKLVETAKAMIRNGLKPVAAVGREGLQIARRPGLLGGRRQSVAAGHRHPASRDLWQLSGRSGDPEMRL